MICPSCKAEGNAAERISEPDTWSTLLGWGPYTDAAGTHYHDANHHVDHYSCSSGHEFKVLRRNVCQCCDWKGPEKCDIGGCRGAYSEAEVAG